MFQDLVNHVFHVTSEAVDLRCSVEKMFLDILQNPQENICARVSFFIKLQALVLSCDVCEISKKTSGGCLCKLNIALLALLFTIISISIEYWK